MKIIILVSLLALLFLIPVSAQRSGRPKKPSPKPPVTKPTNEIIEQIARDLKFVKECIANCGITAVANILELRKVELNADDNPELIVESTRAGPENCSGDCVLCGARRCPQWLYRKAGNRYELLLEAEGSDGIFLLKTATNGYRNVRILYPGGFSYPASEEIYKFDGRRYQKWGQRDLR